MSIAVGDPVHMPALPRGAFALLWATLRTLAARPLPFLTATAVVVVPLLLLVDGVAGDRLSEGRDAEPAALATVVALPLAAVALPALVTALHCMLVRDLVAGRPLLVRNALRAARPHAAAAVGAVTLSALAVLGGLLLLLVPGIWLTVRLYFGAQAAVLEGLPAFDALQRSGALVKGRWWSTAWRLGGLLRGHVRRGLPGRPRARRSRSRARDRARGVDRAPMRAAVDLGALHDAALPQPPRGRRVAPRPAVRCAACPRTDPPTGAWGQTRGARR